MLETPQERVKLLKAGLDGKTIELLYLIHNNFKVVRMPVLLDTDNIDNTEKKNVPKSLSKSNTRVNELNGAVQVKIEQFSANPLWNKAKV